MVNGNHICVQAGGTCKTSLVLLPVCEWPPEIRTHSFFGILLCRTTRPATTARQGGAPSTINGMAMKAFCCCTSRRRGRTVDGRDGNAIPLSEASGLFDTALHQERGLGDSRASRHPPADYASSSAQVSPREVPVDVCQLMADNDSDGEHETSHSARRSTRTLSAVRAKLIKHMSHDIDIDRQSRTAVGHSKEELARRAELRRLRQKRIQDELEKECVNDDGSVKSHQSTRHLSTLIDFGQPGGGPRDAIEFTVKHGTTMLDVAASVLQSVPSSTPSHSSCLDLTDAGRGHEPTSSQNGEGLSVTGTAMMTPAASHSQPAVAQHKRHRALSGCAPSPPRLERALGVDSDFDICHGSHAWDDQSALGVWLIAQGMRSRDSSLGRPADQASDRTTAPEQAPPPTQEFGGVPRVIDTETPTEERRITISLPPRLSSEAEANRSQARDGTGTGGSTLRHDEPVDADNLTPSPSRNAPEYRRSATSVARHHVDRPSSNYPSTDTSSPPSSVHTLSNRFSLSQQDIENLELSPFQWHGNFSVLQSFGHSERKTSYDASENHGTYLDGNCEPDRCLERQSQSGFDTKSVAHSDTVSFQQREAELRTIEYRFGKVISRKKTGAAVHSRFREEFPTTTACAPVRASLVAKLQRSISRLSRAPRSLVSIGSKPNPSNGTNVEPSQHSNIETTKHLQTLFNPKDSATKSTDMPSTVSAAKPVHACGNRQDHVPAVRLHDSSAEPPDVQGNLTSNIESQANISQGTFIWPVTTKASGGQSRRCQVRPSSSWPKCRNDLVDPPPVVMRRPYREYMKNQVDGEEELALESPRKAHESPSLSQRLEKVTRSRLIRLLPFTMSSLEAGNSQLQ
ncbi:hypothetical protein DCS_07306 [Drechmeria coniospora]|uniref:Uncharacterized protein n=1 Tax=Drechmeria coniospora TaxID=98403 RepID=A0A151GE39_DRECN|nr:hypothetical protein DCS_07306 [Drechmeria coniospora]KYK55343.1 hypothetical protein DCS_07306 [Drechmeria coniospora]